MGTADVTIRGLLRRLLASGGPDNRTLPAAAAPGEERVPEVVRRLAGGVAHDLNNILLVVQGYADMAAAESAADAPVAAMLAEVSEAAARAGRLVGDLRIIAQAGPLSLHPVDLNESIERFLGTDSPFSWQPGAGLPRLALDQALLERLVGVLSTWVREVGGKNPVLRTETSGGEADRHVRLVVELPGVVLTPDAAGGIFDPYVRGADGGKGPGLRLAVVRAVALRHGGSATAESVPGFGMRIIVRVPAVSLREASSAASPSPPSPAAATAAMPAAASAPSPLRTQSILLAEDDEALRVMALKVLQREGYTVVSARDGQEAVELFERHRDAIGLLLLDDVMPRMGGRAVLAKIRALRPGIPAIMASGYAWSLAESPGPADVALLPKPWRPRELLAQVHRQLEGAP